MTQAHPGSRLSMINLVAIIRMNSERGEANGSSKTNWEIIEMPQARGEGPQPEDALMIHISHLGGS